MAIFILLLFWTSLHNASASRTWTVKHKDSQKNVKNWQRIVVVSNKSLHNAWWHGCQETRIGSSSFLRCITNYTPINDSLNPLRVSVLPSTVECLCAWGSFYAASFDSLYTYLDKTCPDGPSTNSVPAENRDSHLSTANSFWCRASITFLPSSVRPAWKLAFSKTSTVVTDSAHLRRSFYLYIQNPPPFCRVCEILGIIAFQAEISSIRSCSSILRWCVIIENHRPA
mgnify:FL=1